MACAEVMNAERGSAGKEPAARQQRACSSTSRAFRASSLWDAASTSACPLSSWRDSCREGGVRGRHAGARGL